MRCVVVKCVLIMSASKPLIVSPTERRQSSRFTSGTAIILYVAFVRIVLYLIAGPNYGYFRDELYYLACGEHPAWGYVDQPPLIAWIAWLLQHTIGTSIWALRLLPALSGVAITILAGLLARELGGRRWAMFLASLAALMAPIFLALSHLFTMNAFDPLLWIAIAYVIVRIAKDGDQRLWLAVGALAGITILNKYGVVFWLSGFFTEEDRVREICTQIQPGMPLSSLQEFARRHGMRKPASVNVPEILVESRSLRHHGCKVDMLNGVVRAVEFGCIIAA